MVYTLAASKSGGIFAGGVLDQAGGVDVYGITHFNGQRWENLGQGVALAGDISAQVNAVAVDAGGRVYVGGLISTVGGLHVNNIAMWDGSRWHDLGGGVSPSVDGTIHALLVVGDDLYVGGIFTQAGGISASRVAKWNRPAGRWSALGAGIDGSVYALAYGDGQIYAGGSFTRAGGVEALDVAAWNGTSWAALGGAYEIFEVLDSGNEAGTFARALAYKGGRLFIGGHFQTIHRKDASPQDPTSYVYVHNLIGYTPGNQSWFTIGQGGAMGVTTNGFSGFSTTAYALAVVNGGLYIGGTFNRGGGMLTPNLARWDLSTGAWSSPGVPSSTGELNVRALAGLGNRLLVGGTFINIGNASARSVAILNTNTGAWDVLGSGLGWRNGVPRASAVAIRADGLYIGGEISQAGPHPSLGFARYSGNFGVDPPPVLNRRIYLPMLRR
jgi:trimeric autotransporter adhesin